MKLFIVLALVSVASASLSISDLQVKFKAAKDEFGSEVEMLSSGSKSDDKEQFIFFAKAANFVEDHNTQDGEEWTAEINKFSLETDAEKALSLGLNVSQVLLDQQRSMMKRSSPSKLMVRALEADYTHKLPAIKNQGGCGSCWAFGATASLEYQVNKDRTGTMLSLSEQQYLDCVYEGSRDGCRGGWPTECYTWTKNNGNMIASTASMPYKGVDGACNTNVKSGISGFRVTGSKYLAKGDTAMLAAVSDVEIGVISVAIGVVDSFYAFKSGVYSGTNCDAVNHAVDVVGYGELNGVGYFRCRNSWGNWGDAGYFNQKRGLNGANVNMCQIAEWGHYPLVSGADDGSNDDDNNDDSDDDDDSADCWQSDMGKFPDSAIISQPQLTTMEQCLSWCGAAAGCKAVAVSPSSWAYRECFMLSTDEFSARTSWTAATMSCSNGDDDDDDDEEEEEEEEEKKTCVWIKEVSTKLKGKLSGLDFSLSECQDKCLETKGCKGCSCKSAKKCMMNKRFNGKTNSKFDNYQYKCES